MTNDYIFFNLSLNSQSWPATAASLNIVVSGTDAGDEIYFVSRDALVIPL
jgi:hypothetical protein